MALRPAPDGVITVSFLLIPEFSMVALLSAIEPMRVANRMARRECFRWRLLSGDGAPVQASNQLTLQPCIAIADEPAPVNLFVCSSFHPERYLDPALIAWLQKIARQGPLLGAVDTGCYLLQAAGLIKNHRITLHWEAIPAFREQFPALDVSNELFEIDRNLITCAGGTAALDLMLHVIQVGFGHELAISVCEQFIKSGIRQKSDTQRIDLAARLGVYHPRLLQVLEQMENHLDEPLSQEALARAANVSLRQLERLFRQHLRHTPAAYYLQLRLERARALLQESRLSVAEVALACGFAAVAHFSRAYRKHYGCAPSAERPGAARVS
ncbi:GlxA family transcriptional regulator [Castellaniella caeni]|uniref:GlxA family transcriptional regulator n=1 Tax=Castellaniella caeni TaxID=266123 RepID=UPI00082CBC91|nr:GlxA family transcriptional regulator [Castellaniella caeni]